jgi:signal transduction histidine kinase
VKLNFHDAEELLKSSRSHDRFKGAVFFVMHGTPEHADLLKASLVNEGVSHIKKTIERAIKKSGDAQVETEPSTVAPFEDSFTHDRIRSDIVNEVSSTFIHELGPMLGLLKHSASKEVSGYEISETKSNLDRMDRLFKGIAALNSVTRLLPFEELDLSSFVSTVIKHESELYPEISVLLHGNSPCVVKCSLELLEVALTNGLKNAFESIRSCSSTTLSRKVVISWGTTEAECWIAINDDGLGFEEAAGNAFAIGATTKDRSKHAGFGLAIVEQVMYTLDGEVQLDSEGLSKGARLLLKWNRRDVS